MTGNATTFYLGTHMPHWLGILDIPLFVSRTRLFRHGADVNLPRARGPWAMDSGGFWEITHRGGWRISPQEYAAEVRRARDEIGGLDWAAPMDWMCEPDAIKKTGLSVQEHQERTIDNWIELRSIAPDLPIIPVLQGWVLSDYHRCVERYFERGIDLSRQPVVGLGSVCRRQATEEIEAIVRGIGDGYEIRLHGFGVKKLGLQRYAKHLLSADSLAWSYRGYRVQPCAHGPNKRGVISANEANCLPFALEWRSELLQKLELAA